MCRHYTPAARMQEISHIIRDVVMKANTLRSVTTEGVKKAIQSKMKGVPLEYFDAFIKDMILLHAHFKWANGM